MRPLEGIKVVDFTQAHAGSLATMILADFGAEVIKIERAGVGDLARYWAPIKDDNSGYYAFLNRGKKSLSINATKEEGKEIIRRLLKDADVVCENFKLGSMERMGFSYEEVQAINPEIIYASLNGFGQTGPLKKNIGLDLQLQAMSGMMDSTGSAKGAPTKVGAALGDHLSGTYMAMAINLALINKKLTGKGQKIDIAILDAIVALLGDKVVSNTIGKASTTRTGNLINEEKFSDTFKGTDGYVMISLSSDEDLKTLVNYVDLNENIDTLQQFQNSYKIEIKAKIESKTSKLQRREIVEELSGLGVTCVSVNTVNEAMSLELVKEHNMLIEVEDKAIGKIAIPGTVIKMDGVDHKIKESSPLLGEHTEYYLKQLGYTAPEIETLKENRIIEIA